MFTYRNSYHPIPRDRGGYDTFEILREDLDAKLKNMLSERVTETDNNATSATKILYSSCMNTSKFKANKKKLNFHAKNIAIVQ